MKPSTETLIPSFLSVPTNTITPRISSASWKKVGNYPHDATNVARKSPVVLSIATMWTQDFAEEEQKLLERLKKKCPPWDGDVSKWVYSSDWSSSLATA
jgi:hypothetical protein